MTQAALEARRKSLEKARSVPPEILYRSTPKRREACRANLGKGREAKKRKREAGRATGIRNGLACAELRGSLAAIGATPQELDAHRQALLTAFKPRTAIEKNLVLGIADCLWRRKLALEGESVEGMLSLTARMKVAAEPEQAGLGTVVIARLAIDAIQHPQTRGLTFGESLTAIHGRFAHLSYLLLAGRGEEEGFPNLRWNRSNIHMVDWSAEAMGNPFLRPEEVAKILAEKSGEMKPASEFEWQGKAARAAARAEKMKQAMLETPPHSDWWDHQGLPVADLLKGRQGVQVVMEGGGTVVELKEGEPKET